MIGLGAMGLPMAKNMAAALVPSQQARVTVSDLNPGAVADAEAAGCSPAYDMAQVAESELIISSLPRSADVLGVAQQLCASGGLRPGSIWVDTTSGVPATSREVAELVAAHGVEYLDAGVAGGPRGAEAGQLAAMVGGNEAVLDAVRPALAHIMGKVVHIGPVGAGHAVKSVNNTLLAAHIVVAAEGLTALVKQGVPVGPALEAINAASGRSLVTEERIPDHVLSGKFDFGFAIDLMNKDISICMAQLNDNDLAAPTLRQVATQFANAEHKYGSKAEHMHVMELAEADAGVVLRNDDVLRAMREAQHDAEEAEHAELMQQSA